MYSYNDFFTLICIKVGEMGGSVSIVTRPWAGQLGLIHGKEREGKGFFPLTTTSRLALGPTQSSFSGGRAFI
jgi:hypothetical protein